MALLVHCQVSAGAAVSKSPSTDNLRINGILMYDNSKNQDILGLYSYTVTAPVTRRVLNEVPRLWANGNTVVIGDEVHTYRCSVNYGYVDDASYYVYDLATGERKNRVSVGYDLATAYSHWATSSAINPADGKVYCSGYDYDEASKSLICKLKIWNVAANTKTTVGDMQAPLQVMAFDAQGNLYGITASSSQTSADGGYLVKVDTSTGELTRIGDTGVRPYFDQSAAIDPVSGVFYWFANLQDETANLYTVDLTTAAVSLVGALPDGDEVVGAYFPVQTVADSAPSAVKNLALDFTGPALSGKVNFIVPDKDYSGNTLGASGLRYVVKTGGEVIAGGDAAVGACSADVTVPASGMYKFTVSLVNGAGSGPDEDVSGYIGYDVPQAIAAVTLVREGNSNTLTWEAPSAGENGGWMQQSDLRYRIVRSSDSKIVAEAHSGLTFTENFDTEILSKLRYTVTPVNGDVEGESTVSNSVTVGKAIVPPYSQDFTDANSMELFATINANKDDCEWYYSVKSAKYRGSRSLDADDYLILPPLKLEGGKSYELSFDGYCLSASYTNVIDVLMGTSATAEGLSTVLASDLTYKVGSRDAINTVLSVKPAADGIYYIAFHIKSEKNQSTFTIDNIEVSAGVSTTIPAAVTNLKVIPGENGALSANISFTTPTTTSGGAELKEITKIVIFRGDVAVETFDATRPGSAVIVPNETVPASGMYTYRVVCYNSAGAGDAAVADVYIGIDDPAAPEKVTLVDNCDGTATVSWTAVASAGVNGGYVDASKVRYVVYSSETTVAEDNISATTTTVELDNTGAQSEKSVYVGARYTDTSVQAKTESNKVLSGAPYTVPYVESFANATSSTSPWFREVVSGKLSGTSWDARPDQAQDADGGSADMTGYASGASSRWVGPKIDISDAQAPALTAYVLMPAGNMSFALQIQKDYGEWVTLKSVDEATDWVKLSADLTPHKSKIVRLGLLGTCHRDINFIYVDNIRIDDSSSAIVDAGVAEVSITAAAGAVHVAASEAVDITVTSVNGVIVYSGTAARVSVPVASGLYIVKAGSRVDKVAVR